MEGEGLSSFPPEELLWPIPEEGSSLNCGDWEAQPPANPRPGCTLDSAQRDSLQTYWALAASLFQCLAAGKG